MAANIIYKDKCCNENETDTSDQLVILHQRKRHNNVYPIKSVFVCRALISTTPDMSLSGSGLFTRQNKLKG